MSIVLRKFFWNFRAFLTDSFATSADTHICFLYMVTVTVYGYGMVKDFPRDNPGTVTRTVTRTHEKSAYIIIRKKVIRKYLWNYWYEMILNWGEIWYNPLCPVHFIRTIHGQMVWQSRDCHMDCPQDKKDFSQNIAFQICICYNANRQRETSSPYSSTTTKSPSVPAPGLFYSLFWNGRA